MPNQILRQVTAIFEGNNHAVEYHLNLTDKGKFQVIQKQQLPEWANCLKVRSSKTVELIPVSAEFCQ